MSLKLQAIQLLKEMAEKQRAEIMQNRTMRELPLKEIKEVMRLDELLNTYRADIAKMTEEDGFVTMYPDLKDFK